MKPQTRINTFTGKHKDTGTQDPNLGVCSMNTFDGEEKLNQFYMDFKANIEKLHLEGPELRWQHEVVQTRG